MSIQPTGIPDRTTTSPEPIAPDFTALRRKVDLEIIPRLNAGNGVVDGGTASDPRSGLVIDGGTA